MVSFRSGRRARADRSAGMLRGAAIGVLVAGVAASGLLAHGWQSTVTRQRNERLDRAAATRTATIAAALANYESALQAARSLWLASDRVRRSEFSAFARSLDLAERYPGLQGIGWRSLVTDRDVPAFLARTRADGEPGFTIRPPGRRPVAFELLVPVYRIELPAQATVAERRRQFLGWATGQFRAADFLTAAMRTAQPGSGVELHDTEAGDQILVATYPRGFRASGPYVRDDSFT